MVKVGFYLLTIGMITSPLPLFMKADHSKKLILHYSLLVVFWISYVVLLSASGILANFKLPPRLPLLIVIPMLVFMIFVTRTSAFKSILTKSTNQQLIGIQSFRILVELLIYGAFLNNIFPRRATFEGLNYDILVGVSAPAIAYLSRKKIIGRKGILAWNITGLAILSVTVYSFISSYYFMGYSNTNSLQFINPPYLFLASVLLPFALFYHILSMRKQLL